MSRNTKRPTHGKLHEQSFNVALAEVLAEQHGVWPRGTAEILGERTRLARGRSRPDVIIGETRHRPVAIEVDLANARSAEQDARARLGLRLRQDKRAVELAIAVIAPKEARTWPQDELRDAIRGTQNLRYVAFLGTEAAHARRWPEQGWMEGSVADLAQTARALGIPSETLAVLAEETADLIDGMAGGIMRFAHAGIHHRVGQLQAQFEIGDAERALRATAVIWLNALLMQHRLAMGQTPGIPDPGTARSKHRDYAIAHRRLIEQWDEVLKVNYRSIFVPAQEALTISWAPSDIDGWLHLLHEQAVEIESAQVGSMVDVGGELFPRVVLEDRSAAAAYYTTAPIGEMLAWLTLPEGSDVLPDWGDTSRVAELRVGDLACGTGTLLRALYRRLRHLHGSAGGDNSRIHRPLMERGLIGVDISPIAAHLTATGLASMEPSLIYEESQVGMARVGAGGRIGSLEAFNAQSLGDLLGETVSTSWGQTAKSVSRSIAVPHGGFDVLMMNPPYTRPKGGEYVFDVHGMTEADRAKCMQRWAKMIRDTPAQSRAGLGASFTVLADKKLRLGGRLGIVLPMSVSADPSWRGIRSMLAEYYDDLIVVNLTNLKGGSLSADTAMSEVLIIGTKARTARSRATKSRSKTTGPTTALFINLDRGPAHFAESYALARTITQIDQQAEGDQGYVTLGEETVGSWTRRPVDRQGTPWEAVGASDTFIADAAAQLRDGMLRLPQDETVSTPIGLPMITLGELFEVGPTHHLIGHLEGREPIGAFAFVESKVRTLRNASLWATQSDVQTAMRVAPTHQGAVQDKAEAHRMLKTKSDLLIARSCRWTSQRIAACRTEKPAMGGRAFTTLEATDPGVKAAFQLWANSTLGLLVRWVHGSRQQPGRSSMQITSLKDMPVPNFNRLSKAKRALAMRHAKRLEGEELLPCALAHRDPTRGEIDAAVCEILDLPQSVRDGLAELTELWCREPTVHGHSKVLMEQLPQ